MLQEVLQALIASGRTVAVAEGDTGGLLLERLTSIPGSSAAVLGGVVAYHDVLKTSLLRVPESMLQSHGAVSAEVAEAMAAGVRVLAQADIGVAATGIAGPGGATATKPVGLVFVAVADARQTLVREHRWQGDRAANRAASARAAVELLREILKQ